MTIWPYRDNARANNKVGSKYSLVTDSFWSAIVRETRKLLLLYCELSATNFTIASRHSRPEVSITITVTRDYGAVVEVFLNECKIGSDLHDPRV
jgi:hypothetical protein